MSMYDPSSYPTGVLSPLGPRKHNFPTRYHGLFLSRPEQRNLWMPRPLWGVSGPGCAPCAMGRNAMLDVITPPDEHKGPSAVKIVVALAAATAVVAATLYFGPKLVGAR